MMTSKNKDIKLEEICEGTLDFKLVLDTFGLTYCGIKPAESGVQCKYRAKDVDFNGLFRCYDLHCRTKIYELLRENKDE